jgi:RHS repeat-associated protein
MAFNVVRITDTEGQVVAAREYDAFGNILSETGDWSISDLGFHSDWVLMKNSGGTLYLTPAGRVYDTRTGRFLQRDKLGVRTGQNRYVALNNYPTNYVNPLGLAAQPLNACELYDIARVSYPALPDKFHQYKAKISPELLMCLFFQESSFRPTAQTPWAYGLGGMSELAATDVDRYVYEWEEGRTWKEVKSGDPSAQVSATIAYLARLLHWKGGSLRGALRHYGPIDVGYDYADMLLDCEKCLKQSNALGECDYLLQNKAEKEECPRPDNLWACLNQITGRIKALQEWKRKSEIEEAKGKGALWGYRRLFPGGFDIPRPFVQPLPEEGGATRVTP